MAARFKKGDKVLFNRSAWIKWIKNIYDHPPSENKQGILSEQEYIVLNVAGNDEDGWYYELEPDIWVCSIWCKTIN